MSDRLNGRDFITIGIFNAIGLVIYMAVALGMAMTVVGGFAASGAAFGLAAPVYLLMGVKIKKRGVFIISGILLALISMAGGRMAHAIFSIIGGRVCDFLMGNYQNKIRITVGYGLLAMLDMFGMLITTLIFGTQAFIDRATKFNMTQAQIDQALQFYATHWVIFFLILNFILACIGAWIAMKILKKHFQKAGVI